MKSKEFHKLVVSHGWIKVRAEGSHYIYQKNGKMVVVPYHGSKEMGTGLVKKIRKEMGF